MLAALLAALLAGKAGAGDWYAASPAPWADPAAIEPAPPATPADLTPSRLEPAASTAEPATSPASSPLRMRFERARTAIQTGGLNLPEGLRPRLDAEYHSSELAGSAVPTSMAGHSRGYLSTASAYASAYIDFNPGGRVQPYLGAGVGAVRIDHDADPVLTGSSRHRETHLSAQTRLGADIGVSDRLQIFGEYTYRISDTRDTGAGSLPADLRAAREGGTLGLGLRYRFGG